MWNEISTATTLFTNLTYNSTRSSSSSGLISAIQSSLSNGFFYVSVASNYEGENGSGATGWLSLSVTYNEPVSITVMNKMSNYNGGSIGVGINQTAQTVGSPIPISPVTGQTVNLQAIENQFYDGYYWIWNDTEALLNKSKWEQDFGGGRIEDRGSNQGYSFTVFSSDNNSIYYANLRKVCNVDFKNNLVGFSSYGTVTVNGTSYNSPTAQFQVVEQNAISVSATQMYYNINGITYYFSQWNDGSTASSRTIYPGASYPYTANYTGIPTSTPMNITLNYSESGQPVRISWNDHPNVNVTQYKVYRGAKVEGNFTNPVVLATLNRGTTSYTDYNYTVGGSNPGSVAYDVVPYYATEGTWGYVGQNIITASPGDARISTNENALEQAMASEVPTEYAIGNFPNPFNPTTTIKYQLPEAGMVTLKVYDILGREVAELVNETKSAGYYEVNFDASKLTSGVYIYTIQAGKYTESKKMILAK